MSSWLLPRLRFYSVRGSFRNGRSTHACPLRRLKIIRTIIICTRAHNGSAEFSLWYDDLLRGVHTKVKLVRSTVRKYKKKTIIIIIIIILSPSWRTLTFLRVPPHHLIRVTGVLGPKHTLTYAHPPPSRQLHVRDLVAVVSIVYNNFLENVQQ